MTGATARREVTPLAAIFIALVVVAVLALIPMGTLDETPASLIGTGGNIGLEFLAILLIALAVFALAVALDDANLHSGILICAAGVLFGLVLLLRVWQGVELSAVSWAFWVYMAVVIYTLWNGMGRLARDSAPLMRVVVPLLFGGLLVYVWEILIAGFGVPMVILPPPSAILESVLSNQYTLWIDFRHTILFAATIGFAIGCSAGFLIAVLIDRSGFLQRGLLPIGSAVSAMPIVGTAPIMISWFGQDWQAGAAVVVLMTFFPMLVNTLAGLRSTGAMERDLMRSYATPYVTTLVKLRLPNALPFLFNALKLNSTLALIGAIVSEFFGSPIVGMGFRIASEQQRLNLDMVWATITVAAVAGSLAFGLLALLERVATFWHPSQRRTT